MEEGRRGEASRTGEGRRTCQSEREMTGTKERVQEMVQETKRSGWAPGAEGAGGAACHAQSFSVPLKAWQVTPSKACHRAAQHTQEVPRCEAFSFDQLKSHKSFTG